MTARPTPPPDSIAALARVLALPVGTWTIVVVLCCALVTTGAGRAWGQDQSASTPPPPADDTQPITQSTFERIMQSGVASRHWLIRAATAMRLEVTVDPASLNLLQAQLSDRDWRVRAFAVRSLARRADGLALLSDFEDADARVLRTAMMYGIDVDERTVIRLIKPLLRKRDAPSRLLGVELASMCDDADIRSRALESLRDLMNSMTMTQVSFISRRIGASCGLSDAADVNAWQAWFARCSQQDDLLMRLEPSTPVMRTTTPSSGEAPTTRPDSDKADQDSTRKDSDEAQTEGRADNADEQDDGDQDESDQPESVTLPGILGLTDEQFVRFRDDYLSELKQKPVDLVLCIDCTGSMTNTIEAVKIGVDEMLRFLGDVCRDLRVGVVSYAGMPDELRGVKLSKRRTEIRDFIWSIGIGRGGRETVYLAMEAALKGNRFGRDAVKTVVLVGDEPFQESNRQALRELVVYAAREGVTTSTVKATTRSRLTVHDPSRSLPQWNEIATWGDGACVTLDDSGDIVAMIIGLTIGGSWKEEIDQLLRVFKEINP